MFLTRDDLVQLTGYRQRRRQLQWLVDRLKLSPPLRADGLPVVSKAQIEAALAGRTAPATSGPNWSKIAP